MTQPPPRPIAWHAFLPKRVWEVGKMLMAAFATPRRFDIGHLRSSFAMRPMDRHGRPLPWYSYPAIEKLQASDFTGKRVLEFGGGQSTRWWAERAGSLVTIEADPPWAAEIQAAAPCAEVHCVPIDPATRSIQPIRKLLAGRSFDVIVVDGHLREECTEFAVSLLAADGALILDNSEGYGLFDLTVRLGLERVDLWGHSPGVWRRQCTSIAYRGSCFLLRQASVVEAALQFGDRRGQQGDVLRPRQAVVAVLDQRHAHVRGAQALRELQ
jgi:hypothetical protein